MIFILIDDDPICNIINKKVIQNAFEDLKPEFITFLKAEEALDFIKKANNSTWDKDKVFMLLDLNMPGMSGWEFLESIKDLFISTLNIFILSSSIDKDEVEKSKTYSFVQGYLFKPLTVLKINELIKNETAS